MQVSLRALPASVAAPQRALRGARSFAPGRPCAARGRALTVRAMAASFYDLAAKDINGNELKFGDAFRGKVVLITNVASACGYTRSNYAELVQLHDKYAAQGLEILITPCNQFGGQEPGSPEQICKFTADKGVKFKVMEKADVKGAKTHPVWKYLLSQPGCGAEVTWNFNAKFIIDKAGNVVERNSASPMASEAKIKALL